MRQKSNSTPASSETLVRNIRRAIRKHHAAEEKIRIVLAVPWYTSRVGARTYPFGWPNTKAV
jgi:hypothetical protein